mgnify:CR=1 FL=1|tara:strand:- start:134 stop:349 length:216 start_codon:yes stop_codon:yes gene_type:complete
MEHFYNIIEPIYSTFDIKKDLIDYLLNEYKYVIDENNNDNENDNKESWKETLNDALLRLGDYLMEKSIKIP